MSYSSGICFEYFVLNFLQDKSFDLFYSKYKNNSVSREEFIDLTNDILSGISSMDDNNFISMFGFSELFDIYRYIFDIDELSGSYKKMLEDNKKLAIEKMFYSTRDFQKNDGDSVLIDVIELIIDDICLNENVKFSDIEKLGKGSYCSVYKIGHKVLKLGLERNNYLIPDNPTIVRPLLRRNLSIGDDNSIFVEVCEYVKPIGFSLEDEDSVYSVFSKNQECGVDWFDTCSCNVGILEKDNVIHWRRELSPSNDVLGIIDNPLYDSKNHLHAGDYCLLDGDYLYFSSENESPQISRPYNLYFKRYIMNKKMQ